MSNDAVSGALFQHLFRIFSLFADQNTQGTFKPAQAEFLIDELLRELRRQTTPKVHDLPEDVTFNEFLNLLQVIFPDREDLQIATDRVFERYVNQIIGKGFVLFRKVCQKRGCIPFRRRSGEEWQFGWLTIVPGVVKIRKQNTEKDEVITIDEDTVIEMPVLDGEASVWSVSNDASVIFQLSHLDPIIAQLLVKDMRTARDFPNREELARADYKRSLRSRQPNRDVKIRKELENERTRLESELEEERKNRKDEEIVRGLTTRLLKQEIEKSEQMQQVIYELRSKLGTEEEDVPEDVELVELEEPTSEDGENEEISITLPSREERIQQYAYHLYATQAEEQVTSDDEEIWKHNYNLIVSTQSV